VVGGAVDIGIVTGLEGEAGGSERADGGKKQLSSCGIALF
jgi:hypothetical protein